VSKITLDDIVSGFKSVTKLITNFDKIEDDLNNKVLYRDNPEGEPNQMQNDLDMNSQRIVNLVSPVNDSEPARWADVKNGVIGVDEPVPSQTGNAKTPLTTSGTGLVFGQIEADHVDFTPASGPVATVQEQLLGLDNGITLAATSSDTGSSLAGVTAGKMINPGPAGESNTDTLALIASSGSRAEFVRSAVLGSIYCLAEGNSSLALASRLTLSRHNNTYALGTEEAYLNERKAGAISCLRHSGTGTYGVGIASQDCATSANGNSLGRTVVMSSANTVVGEGYNAYFTPTVSAGVLTALAVEGVSSAPAGVAFATTSTITKSSGSWYDEGFHPGENVKVSGSSSNDGIYFITSISTTTMTLRDAPLTVEAFAGTVAPQTGGYGYSAAAAVIGEDLDGTATIGTLTPTINGDGVITDVAVSGTWADVSETTARFTVDSGSTSYSSAISCSGSSTTGRGKTRVEASTSLAAASSGGYISPTAGRAALIATKDCDVNNIDAAVIASDTCQASADYSAVIAGNSNKVSGELSATLGGSGNFLSGARSVLFGRNTECVDNYCLSWGYSASSITETAANQNLTGYIDIQTGEVVTGTVRPLVTQTSNLGSTTRRYDEAWADTLIQTAKLVANLPTPVTGMRAFVTDSTVSASGNFGAVVAGGGTGNVPVFYDGTNWLIG